MLKIYKYEVPSLPTDDKNFTIAMPVPAEVLDIQPQSSMFGVGLMIWAKVNPDSEPVPRHFTWVPTGGDVPENHEYLGTFQVSLGLVYHLYRSN